MTALDPRLLAHFEAENGFPLKAHLIVLANVGSHGHGTYVPPTDPDAIDDVDYMGVLIPPARHLLGLHEWEHWVWQFEELDVVVYSLKKFVTLLLKSNPNVLGLLWMREYTYSTAQWALVLGERDQFSTRQAYGAFIGYAQTQFRKMTAFDLERMQEYEAFTKEFTEAGATIQELVKADANKLDHLCFQYGLNAVWVKQFRTLHRQHFAGYMGAKRKALVERHGYDCKNAAHLIRLMRMCVEFLDTGALRVYRHDAQELIAIKQGQWTLAQVQAEAERLFALAAAAEQHTPLSAEPDIAAAERMVMRLQLWSLSEQVWGDQ